MRRKAASYYKVTYSASEQIWHHSNTSHIISFPFSQQNCRMTVMPIYSWGNCLKLIQQVLLFPHPVLFGRPLRIHMMEPLGGSSGPKSSATNFKQNLTHVCILWLLNPALEALSLVRLQWVRDICHPDASGGPTQKRGHGPSSGIHTAGGIPSL